MQTRMIERAGFRVVDGGGGASQPDMAAPPAPGLSTAELAAEMAELFVFGLIQDVPLDRLTDPHAMVRIDPVTRVSLHELLCELRSLPWYDRPPAAADIFDEGTRRRAARLNADGQLVLRSLMAAGVRTVSSPRLSDFVAQDHQVAQPADPQSPEPSREAPMSRWLAWCAARSGAGLRLPGRSAAVAPPDTCLGVLRHVQGTPPARVFHNAALAALARGAVLDPGLPHWRGGDLFALMAEAERRAIRLGLMQAGRVDRLTRPAVIGARLSVALSMRAAGPHVRPPCEIEPIAEMLATHAPQLVQWMTLANRARRGNQRTDISLFLPLCAPGALPPRPADTVTHMIVAGALATLIKAVFDTVPRPVRMVGHGAPDAALAEDADTMVANTALARLVSGGYLPSENLRDMQLGQTIALQVLRDVLEADNRPVELGFRDFSGRSLRVQSVSRAGGRGHAMLSIDGAPAQWSTGHRRRSVHLTVVI